MQIKRDPFRMSQSVLLVFTLGSQQIGQTICNVARFAGLRCLVATSEEELAAVLSERQVDYVALVLNHPDAALDKLVRIVQQQRCYAPLLAITESAAAAELAASYIPEHGCPLQGTLTIPFTAHSFRQSLELPAPPQPPGQALPDLSEQAEDFRLALARHEITTVMQPRFSTHNLKLQGFEVLARWHHEHREIPPAAFVRLAESLDLAQELTLDVLEQGLQALVQLERQYQSNTPLQLTINLCSSLLQESEFYTELVKHCEAHRVATSQVTLDLAENDIMTHVSEVRPQLEKLHELGFALSFHDFGTGYSTLQQLAKLPLAELKADRHYVLTALERKHSRLMTRATIELAHNLDLLACATGVENQETLDLLRHFDCHAVQGFYLAHPMPATRLTEWLTHEYPQLRDY